MFIELAEYLRCPEDHPETHCVVATSAMVGRDVVSGIVGCPACQREYCIRDGTARFGDPPSVRSDAPLPDAAVLQALLGIATPGGYVVVIGSVAERARELASLIDGVHMVAINPPPLARPGPSLSLLTASASVPLRSAMARGVVLGSELASAPWSGEAARVLLPGLRMVVLAEQIAVAGVAKLAEQHGIWVGQRARGET